MSYLKQFARNRRSKEKSKVLTARLPESLYDEFQAYCDEIGLTISEAVLLLVDKEINSMQRERGSRPEKAINNDNEMGSNTYEYKQNTNTAEMNTFSQNETIQPKQISVKTNTAKKKTSTKRFTTTQFVVNDELPCPICDKWLSKSNFSRHAKKDHDATTEGLLTENIEKVREMIETAK